ncbi:MAG: hypothetical protein IJW70_10085 [Clostridia bacterium]|nr:hypothetical protein [Clostridia bacterium]
MKKLLAIILFAALCIGCLCTGISAATEDYTVDTWTSAELKGLFYQDTDFITSDIAPDYEAWWWEDYVEELDDYFMAATINMRGFSMSADGRYAYMGTLNGGNGVRGVVVLDTQVGKITDLYYSYNEENALPGSPFSYAKGIAADDRGIVYVGFAYSVNYNYLSLGIAQQQDNGKLTEICEIPVYTNDLEPGDEAGTKVGVNGVEVAKIGDKYYCFVMSNYNHDALYCYDVTDPENPVLNKNFGIEGIIDFADADCTIDLGGKHLDEGQYMAVDANGTVWLCASLKEGGTGIIKIDASGVNCLGYTEYSGAYSIAHVGKFLLVGLKNGSAVDVLDDSSMEKVASIAVPDANRITRVQVINDTLYVCGAGDDSMSYNYIYAAPLTADAQTAFDAQVQAINSYKQSEDTGDETESETEAETEPESNTVADTEDTTEAKTEATTTPATEAPDATETEAEQSSSCGGIIGSGAIIAMLTLGACVVAKKKRD